MKHDFKRNEAAGIVTCTHCRVILNEMTPEECEGSMQAGIAKALDTPWVPPKETPLLRVVPRTQCMAQPELTEEEASRLFEDERLFLTPAQNKEDYRSPVLRPWALRELWAALDLPTYDLGAAAQRLRVLADSSEELEALMKASDLAKTTIERTASLLKR